MVPVGVIKRTSEFDVILPRGYESLRFSYYVRMLEWWMYSEASGLSYRLVSVVLYDGGSYSERRSPIGYGECMSLVTEAVRIWLYSL